LVLSADELLRELLGELLQQQRMRVRDFGDVATLLGALEEGAAEAILVDAVSEDALCAGLLELGREHLDAARVPICLLSGGSTAATLLGDPAFARVLRVPFHAEQIVEVILGLGTDVRAAVTPRATHAEI